MTGEKRKYRTQVHHRSQRPSQRAKDASAAFYGLTFTGKDGSPPRLEKTREQRELFEDARPV